MKKALIVIVLLAITALLGGVGVTGYSVATFEDRSGFEETAPSLAMDEAMLNNIKIVVKAVAEPVANTTDYVLVDVYNNGNDDLIIKRIRVNGMEAWKGNRWVGHYSSAQFNAPYHPLERGYYGVLVDYSLNGADGVLQFMVEIHPVNEVRSLDEELYVNGKKIQDEIILNSTEINASLVIKSNVFPMHIRKGVALVMWDYGHWIGEIKLDKTLLPLISVERNERFNLTAKGNFTIKGYLYTDKGGITREINILVK